MQTTTRKVTPYGKRSKISTVEDAPHILAKYGRICRHPDHMQRVPLSHFNANKQNKDGLHSYCKACRNKIKKKWLKKRQVRKRKMLDKVVKPY